MGEQRYPPSTAQYVVSLFLVGIAVVMACVFVLGPQTGPVAQRFVPGLFLIGGAMFVPATLLTTVVVSETAIAQRGLLGNKRLTWGEVQYVWTRTERNRNGSYDATTLHGVNGGSITFTSQRPRYQELLNLVRSHASATALEQGENRAGELRRAEMRHVVALVAAICVLGLGGLGVWMRKQALDQIALYQQLGSIGTVAPGQVTSTWYTSSKNSHSYYEQFAFQSAGAWHYGTSPITSSDYSLLHRGSPMPVRYMSDDPSKCMATNSIGEQKARGQLTAVWVLWAISLVMPGIVYMGLLGQGRGASVRRFA